MPRRIQLLADCEPGDIVRCDVGLVRVGPLSAGDFFCRLVEFDDEDYRDASEPLHLAKRTRVLEVLRGREFYTGHRRAGGGAVDPLRSMR